MPVPTADSVEELQGMVRRSRHQDSLILRLSSGTTSVERMEF